MGQTLALLLFLCLLAAGSVLALKWYSDNFPDQPIPTRRQQAREIYRPTPLPLYYTRLFDGEEHGWPF